jgi:lysophospholipase L1-like esterase
MTSCSFAVALVGVILAVAGFCLTDGSIRLALQFALAKRIGGVFAPVLIVAGDSLAASCPFAKLFRSPFAVLNLATGGATIMEIAGQINRARDIRAEWLLIDGGLNDLLFDDAAPQQTEADFRALFRRISENCEVIVTLMPYVADPAQTTRIEAANLKLSRLCAERGYRVIDLNPLIARNGVRKADMSYDGLHFSPKAEQLWLHAVSAALDEKRGAA